MEWKYKVLAFRQQDGSPIQVAFVAHAGEALNWTGIPRKSDELLTGFQRFKDDNRIDRQIVPFFQYSQNCSPTAVIVALRKDSGLGACSLSNTNIPAGEVIESELSITVDTSALDTDRVFQSALRYVNQRLRNDPPASEMADAGEEEEEEEEEAEDDETQEDADTEVEDLTFHLGSETLARMKAVLEDRDNWSNPKFKEAIADYVKPAFLIDGQHRLFGAAKIGKRGLPFMICGLYDAPWAEQVFQFTVVNLKPKKIAPSLITSIAALSLSRQEQDVLQERLDQAGVKMAEVEIMSLVAYDDRSPFAELVDMGVGHVGRDSSKIGYGAMKRVAKVWHRASRNSLTQIAKQCFTTNNANHARAHWRTERVWFEFFSVFWIAIRDHYPDLWTKRDDNKLFVGVNLWALQEALLIEADGQMPSHWKILGEDASVEERREQLLEKLLEVVRTSLAYLPREMWAIPWAKASLDTNQGRDDVRDLFRKLIDEGKKEGKVWKGWRNEEWFRV